MTRTRTRTRTRRRRRNEVEKAGGWRYEASWCTVGQRCNEQERWSRFKRSDTVRMAAKD